MKCFPQGRQPSLHLLNFMSINVRKDGTTHDITLVRACEFQLDILIQEPWWSGCIKSYPFHDCHIPLVSEEI